MLRKNYGPALSVAPSLRFEPDGVEGSSEEMDWAVVGVDELSNYLFRSLVSFGFVLPPKQPQPDALG